MATPEEQFTKLSDKFNKLQKEQLEVKGELKGIDNQLKEYDIPSADIESWINDTKEELEELRKQLSIYVGEIEDLLEEYDEDN